MPRRRLAALCLLLAGAGVARPSASSGAARAWGAADAESSAAAGAAHGRRAAAALAAGDLPEALKEAEAAALAAPRSPSAHSLRSSALNRLGRYAEAEAAAERSVALREANPSGHENLAFARLHLGRFQEAAISATRAIELAPAGAMAYALRAMAHEQSGARERALADMARAAALDPAQFGERLRAAQAGERLFAPGGSGAPPWLAPVALALGVLAAAGLLGWGFGLLGGGRAEERPPPEAPAAPEPGHAPQAGDALADKYRLVHVIGRGGMGEVWEGRDLSLERAVAVKRFTGPEGDEGRRAREAFLREARAVASLRHRHIADIYDILELPSGLYMVLEFVRGKTAAQLLAERGRLSFPEARDLLRPVCSALDFAHRSGVVHRDLKPSNIMVVDGGVVKVLDFGVARRLDAAPDPRGEAVPPAAEGALPLARTRTVAGTPEYMAPEAFSGLISPALDVYSLGVCLYELLTGGKPRALGSDGRWREGPPASALVPGLPPSADRLIAAAIEWSRKKRLRGARQFEEGLDSV